LANVLALPSGSTAVSVLLPALAMYSVRPPPTALASRIAWRSEPGPESFVFVTLKIEGSQRGSSASRCGGWGPDPRDDLLFACVTSRTTEELLEGEETHGENLLGAGANMRGAEPAGDRAKPSVQGG